MFADGALRAVFDDPAFSDVEYIILMARGPGGEWWLDAFEITGPFIPGEDLAVSAQQKLVTCWARLRRPP